MSVQQLLGLRHAIISDAEQDMARLNMAFAEQATRTVETADFVARNTIEALHSTSSPGDVAKFDSMLRRRIAGLPQVTSVSIADLDGTVLYSSDSDGPNRLPAAAQSSLAWHRTHPDPVLRIGPPFRSAEGKWAALMTRPIYGPRGRVSSIVAVQLNLAYFEHFYRAVDLGESGAITLLLRNGTVLASYPHVDAVIGTGLAGTPLFTKVLAHARAGTLLTADPADGSVRVTAIRALDAVPLTVMVSMDEGELLTGWRRETWIFAALTGTAILFIGGLLLLSVRRSRQAEFLMRELRAAHDSTRQANIRLKAEMAERENAEETLRQAQRIDAIGQLTGGVAHDFNNLLTVILGNVDLLQRGRNESPLDAATAERLRAVRAAAERGATLTGHLLAFARRQPLMPRATDLAACITNMRALLHSALGGDVRLEMVLAPELWPAMIDATQIELLILNLAINARDAMPAGGTVTLQAKNVRHTRHGCPDDLPLGDYVLLTVTDTGTGMTPSVKARAFEPFFTTKAPGSGSGLGLSQVFGTARQLGGSVAIRTALGQGTTISVFLPRAQVAVSPVSAPRVRPVRPAQDGGVAVLLVDDDDAVRMVIATMLRDLGYAVREAASGAEALTILQQDIGVDVVLTDIAMLGMTGVELADAAQALLPELAVVYMSGYAEIPSGTNGAHPRRLLSKPFRPGELREQIEAAIAERHVPVD